MKLDFSDVLIAAGLVSTGVAVYLIWGWLYLLRMVGLLLLLAGILHARRQRGGDA